MQQKWIRTLTAAVIATAIAIQIPLHGGSGVALADTEYPTNNTGGVAEQLATVGTAAIVVYGVSATTGSSIGAGLFTAVSVRGLQQVLLSKAFEFGEIGRLFELVGLPSSIAAMESAVTIFAPTNGALSGIPADELAALVAPQNRAKLSSVLQFHIIEGRYSIAQLKALPNGTPLKTVSGESVIVTTTGSLKLNGIAVGNDDVGFSSGWVHSLNGVLNPAGSTQ